MILCSRGGKCLKTGAFPQGAEHADAPCVMLHGGREAAPSSTARGRSVRGRLLRRLASTATNTVARLDMSRVGRSDLGGQSDAKVWYCNINQTATTQVTHTAEFVCF